MSFWNLSDNTKIEASNEFELGGSEPIPDNTDVLAAPDEVKWDEYDGESYISIRWNIFKPDDYAGRKVFQKLKVHDPKKSDKAKKMLAAIDANAGGKLMASGQAPTDELLQSALVNKPMIIKLMVWEMNGNSGNWVSKVSPKGEGMAAPTPAPKQDDDLEEVPF